MKVDRHGKAKILTTDEINLVFYEGLKNDRDRAIFAICLYTALRQQTDKKQRWTYNQNYLTYLEDGLRRGLRLILFDSFSRSKG